MRGLLLLIRTIVELYLPRISLGLYNLQLNTLLPIMRAKLLKRNRQPLLLLPFRNLLHQHNQFLRNMSYPLPDMLDFDIDMHSMRIGVFQGNRQPLLLLLPYRDLSQRRKLHL